MDRVNEYLITNEPNPNIEMNVEGNPTLLPDSRTPIPKKTQTTHQPDSDSRNTDGPSAEDIALGSKPPLRTLLVLSIGPFISQLTQALFGLIDTMWINKALGDKGVTEVSTYSNFDTIGRAFGFFLNVAASTKISSLFGAGLGHQAPQLLVDLLRVAFILSVFVPVVLIPCLKPAARWFGATYDIVEEGFEYILPVIVCAFIPILYLTFCGCLLAEGRTMIFGLLQTITLILNVVIFDPLLLLALRWGMLGNALATILAEGLPMIVIATLYFCGKFSVKPKIGDFFKKFSPHTWPALKVGFSQLFYQLSLAVPGIVLRKFLGLSSTDETYIDIVAGFNAQIRLYQIVFMVTAAVSMGFLPCASYAIGAQRYKRALKLLMHTCWVSFGWTALTMIGTVAVPRLVSMMFSNTEGYLNYATQFIRNSNVVAFVSPVALIIQALLQALQLGNAATIISIGTQLIPLPVFSAVLYYTNKHNPGRLLYAYAIQQALGVVIAVPLGIKPFFDLLKKSKNEREFVNEKGQIIVEHDESGQPTAIGSAVSHELEEINDVVEV
ncbi:MatE family protein [Tritrichomonas foetus]|uniref:MatE family protein n=1 Tax=Tritrichomonas foetus TaxID=1144522 RepID=A0A1J4KMH5_9EUKA|nr:MatE family protein [Tritrichomonas foetus]|eukprot:OHT12427.1 MatE family protein [Tritrichomonas foetus]